MDLKKAGCKNQGHCYSKREEAAWPHGICYSHFGNEVCNGAISITQRGFINDFSKVNPIGQWGKILMMAMGIEDHLGHCRSVENQSFGSHNLVSCLNVGH